MHLSYAQLARLLALKLLVRIADQAIKCIDERCRRPSSTNSATQPKCLDLQPRRYWRHR